MTLLQNLQNLLTFHSNMITAMPDLAAVPAVPTKLFAPILLANRDIPIWKKKHSQNESYILDKHKFI